MSPLLLESHVAIEISGELADQCRSESPHYFLMVWPPNNSEKFDTREELDAKIATLPDSVFDAYEVKGVIMRSLPMGRYAKQETV